METHWVYDDGGRSEAGFKGQAGDCVTRAIAIATGKPYKKVYNDLAEGMQKLTGTKSARNGVNKKVYQKVLKDYGWRWVPTMGIGQGTKVHLDANELPDGVVITRLSRHLATIIDGVIHDTHDPSRGGSRAVYGYWVKDN